MIRAWALRNKETDEHLQSCAMVITEPNTFAAEVHEPSSIETKDFEQWERGDTKDAAALMKPAAEYVLQKWPVSKRVNNSRAPDDDPTLIEQLDEVSATAVAERRNDRDISGGNFRRPNGNRTGGQSRQSEE